MKQDRIDQLWDDYRDGTLGDDDARAFEQALRDDPDRRARFDAESRWLKLLAQPDDACAHGEGFARDVTDRWRRERAQPVAGRIGGRAVWSVVRVAAIAAMVLLAVWLVRGLNDGHGADAPDRLVRNDGPGDDVDPARAAKPDPLGTLVRDMDATVTNQPARLRQAVRETAALLDVDRVMTLIGDVPVPDPAKYLDPKQNNKG